MRSSAVLGPGGSDLCDRPRLSLQVRHDQPEVLVDRARDLCEEVGRVLVAKLGGRVDPGADGATEGSQAVGDHDDRVAAVDRIERVLVQ